MNIPDPLSPLLPIVHRPRQVFRTTTCICYGSKGYISLGKERVQPFVHLSIMFWLYTALQYRSSMSSNFLVFHTSGDISSSPAAFLFLIFLSTTSSCPWVNYLSLTSNWLLIFVIGLSVTLRDFHIFLKCSFHMCIRSSWLAAFNLALGVLFLSLTQFPGRH